MWSIPGGTYERICDFVSLWRAFRRTRCGKRSSRAVLLFEPDADLYIGELHQTLTSGDYQPRGFTLSVIRDPKIRVISAPKLRDRIVHQALVGELAPHFERRFSTQHFGCATGRGPHRALVTFLKAMRRHRFRLSLDIRRYFPSVHVPTLLDLYRRRLRDPRTVKLIHQLLDVGSRVYQHPLAVSVLGPAQPDCGLAIGSLLSQFSAGLYLDGLDQFVPRELKIGAYLRYVDDISMFSDDKNALLDARSRIMDWLGTHRSLRLNPKRWDVHPTHEPLTYLGYRVSKAGFGPGPKMRRRIRNNLRIAFARGPDALQRTLNAYRGLWCF